MNKRLPAVLMCILVFVSFAAPSSAEDSFFIYRENYFQWFHASGWMGDTDDLFMNSGSSEDPYVGKTCVKIKYRPEKSHSSLWGGIYWQYPVNNWGREKGREKLKGVKSLIFFARGKKGGEVVIVKVGGITGKEYSDSDAAQEEFVLTDEWKEYRMNLDGKDLSHIIGGFAVLFTKISNPQGATVYFDEIEYTKK